MCTLYDTQFHSTAFFYKGQDTSSTPVQRAVVCGVNEKMVYARANYGKSATRFCVHEDLENMKMPTYL